MPNNKSQAPCISPVVGSELGNLSGSPVFLLHEALSIRAATVSRRISDRRKQSGLFTIQSRAQDQRTFLAFPGRAGHHDEKSFT